MAESNKRFIRQVKSHTMDERTERPSAYIPRDRRQALYAGVAMPDRVEGAALFADISGFTPLTESLLQDLGPQRGAEELSRQLNLVYDALIAELHRFGGSVISFSGDAITCWLDGDDGFRGNGLCICHAGCHGAICRNSHTFWKINFVSNENGRCCWLCSSVFDWQFRHSKN